MKLQRGAIIIVDVSGYTEFVKMHTLSIIHAEGVISALMTSIVKEFNAPAKLNKLEGDAAMIFVPLTDPDKEAEIIQRVTEDTLHAFRAFKIAKQEMSSTNICPCGSCSDIDSLRLKAIFHLGEVVVKGVLGREELAGDSVIVAHRLLKNTVESEEYFLMTEPYFNHVKHMFDGDYKAMDQAVDGYGDMKVGVIEGNTLNQKIGELPISKRSLIKGFLQVLSIQYYYYKLRKSAKYAHLPA